MWSPFGSLPLVTRGIGLRVHKMGAFRSWLWLKIGPKTQRNVWRKRRWRKSYQSLRHICGLTMCRVPTLGLLNKRTCSLSSSYLGCKIPWISNEVHRVSPDMFVQQLFNDWRSEQTDLHELTNDLKYTWSFEENRSNGWAWQRILAQDPQAIPQPSWQVGCISTIA